LDLEMQIVGSSDINKLSIPLTMGAST
jgi:hypothetical protein